MTPLRPASGGSETLAALRYRNSRMLNLIARRLALGLLVALTVMTLAFMLTRLSGDLAISIAGPRRRRPMSKSSARPTASTARSMSSSSAGSAAP